MSKIAFLGPKEIVTPLAASGIDIFPCDSVSHSCQNLSALLHKKEHSIIFVTERLAAEIPETIKEAEKKEINVVLLPDHRGSIGLFKELAEGLLT
ncbi:MAG: hypothetical protein KKC80_04225 [Candidatus Margulisbacteria bacterium]|nr:hypothetical protein [Candidatus Margulisiibacteriota bacterium]MBU1616217.1 hypothetical protein [Candidatus Margulisiibacteriota bacterium]MBU1867401.1 hypothetical protein [Candidatus Margulisiibacteriota bacterium]